MPAPAIAADTVLNEDTGVWVSSEEHPLREIRKTEEYALPFFD